MPIGGKTVRLTRTRTTARKFRMRIHPVVKTACKTVLTVKAAGSDDPNLALADNCFLYDHQDPKEKVQWAGQTFPVPIDLQPYLQGKATAQGWEVASARLKQQAAAVELVPGTYVVRIQSGDFSFWSDGQKEPFVLLRISGGEFVNLSTGVKTSETFASLNGYADTLTLKVTKTTTVFAFFLDCIKRDNRGSVMVAFLKA